MESNIHRSTPTSGQLDDIAYPSILLSKHGVGVGRGARLEEITNNLAAHVDHELHAASGDEHIDRHASPGPR